MTKSTNFFNSNKYRIILSRLPDVELFCQKVSLPGITIPSIKIAGHLSGQDLMDSFSGISYENLTFTFIIDENMENYISVVKWLKTISPDDDLHNIYKESIIENEGLDYTDISVFIKNNNQQNIGEFIYKRCVPISLSGLELSVSEDLIMTATLSFEVSELDFNFKYSQINKNAHGLEIPSYCPIEK